MDSVSRHGTMSVRDDMMTVRRSLPFEVQLVHSVSLFLEQNKALVMAYINVLTIKTEAPEAEAMEFECLPELDTVRMMLDASFASCSKQLLAHLMQDEEFQRYSFFAPAFTAEISKHLVLHEQSEFSYESDTEVLLWVHSSITDVLGQLDGNE
eukprot:6253366-Amphidinium_carterae.1